jgi:hypothetical protein
MMQDASCIEELAPLGERGEVSRPTIDFVFIDDDSG